MNVVLEITDAMNWLAFLVYPSYVVAFYVRLWLELLHWRITDFRESQSERKFDLLCVTLVITVECAWGIAETLLILLEDIVHHPNALPLWMKTFDISHYPLRPDYSGTE